MEERKAKVLILGGGPGGRVAYMALRRMGVDSVALVADEEPTVICSLPYGVGRRLVPDGPEKVVVDLARSPRLPEDMPKDVIWGTVHSVDPQGRTAQVVTRDGEVRVSYESLILAPGAAPWLPELPGVLRDAPGEGGPTVMVGNRLVPRGALGENVHVLRGARDARDLDELAGWANRVVVVGTGAIGLETAEAFADRGVAVTLVEVLDHVVAALDPELAAVVENTLWSRKVEVLTGVKAAAVEPGGLRLEDGRLLEADGVVFASGVRPRLDLPRAMGVATDRGILTDSRMATNLPGVYAVGDAAQIPDAATGRSLLPLIGTLAMRQALVAAANLVGMPMALPPATVWGVSEIFGLHWGSVGWTLEAATRAGIQAFPLSQPVRSRDPFMAGRDGVWRLTVAAPGNEGLAPGQILGFQVVTEGDSPLHLAERFVDVVTRRETVQDLFARYFIHSPSHNGVDDPYLGLLFQAQEAMRQG